MKASLACHTISTCDSLTQHGIAVHKEVCQTHHINLDGVLTKLHWGDTCKSSIMRSTCQGRPTWYCMLDSMHQQCLHQYSHKCHKALAEHLLHSQTHQASSVNQQASAKRSFGQPWQQYFMLMTRTRQSTT